MLIATMFCNISTIVFRMRNVNNMILASELDVILI